MTNRKIVGGGSSSMIGRTTIGIPTLVSEGFGLED